MNSSPTQIANHRENTTGITIAHPTVEHRQPQWRLAPKTVQNLPPKKHTGKEDTDRTTQNNVFEHLGQTIIYKYSKIINIAAL